MIADKLDKKTKHYLHSWRHRSKRKSTSGWSGSEGRNVT